MLPLGNMYESLAGVGQAIDGAELLCPAFGQVASTSAESDHLTNDDLAVGINDLRPLSGGEE